ncbi:MAG: response regulator [Bacteroidales bacterium]
MSPDENDNGFSLPKLIGNFGRKPHILCVEDNEINAQLIQQILNEYCEVDWAPIGEKALEMVKIDQFDLILMDLGLGSGMDGVETTEKIHKIPGYEQIPVAAVSGYLLSYSKETLSEAGIDYILAKPFTRMQLLNLVQDILIKQIYSAPESFPDTPIGAP